MFKTLMAATAAITLMSGMAMTGTARADEVGTTTTRQSTGIGPLKFETDRTVRHDDMATGRDHVEVQKNKTVTKDWDGDTTSKSKTETTTVR